MLTYIFSCILCFVCLVCLCISSLRSMLSYEVPYEVQEIPDFLTPEECDTIIDMSHPNLIESEVYTGANDDSIDTTHRKSEQCWLKDHEHELVEKLSHKVAELTQTDLSMQEELQVVKYTQGGFFNPHFDACNGDKEFCKRMDDGVGPRYITVLIYLNDDFTGGETVFPSINKSVKPQKGKAVIFYNTHKNTGEILKKSFHGGNPVLSGNKWICNKWIKNKL